MGALVEPHIYHFQVADFLGEDYRLGPDGVVDDMVLLYIAYGIGQTVHERFLYFRSYLPFVKQFAERVSIHVVGDYAHPQPGHFLEVIDHYDVGVRQIIAHVKLLADHLEELLFVAVSRTQGLEHDPFAMFLCGVHLIELLVPFGKVLYLGPFGLVLCHMADQCIGCDWKYWCSLDMSK